jgi:hypothetical protein
MEIDLTYCEEMNKEDLVIVKSSHALTQTPSYKYIALYYDNCRKEVTFGLYGVFNTVDNAENYLLNTIIKPIDGEKVVEIDRKCHILNEKYQKIDIDTYVCMLDKSWNGEQYGEFVKGFICAHPEHLYYCSIVYVIVKTQLFE